MTTKACTQCGVVKPLAAFHKKKSGKFGRRADCKECVTARSRAYYEANREKENSRSRAYREFNREKIAAYDRAYYEANREKVAAQQRAYYEANREKISARSRAYHESNREKDNARNRAYHEANREKDNARNRAYREFNREKIAAQKRAYRDANREKCNAIQRAYSALIGNPTADKWKEISLKHATRKSEPWSEEEDRYLANSTARAIDDALALHRTYSSVKSRRLRLRRAGVIEKQTA